MRGTTPDQFGAYERILLLLDQSPCGEVFRIGIGYLLVPLSSSNSSASVHPELTLAYWFLGVLLALRLVPVVIRKTLPFPERVVTVWSERRQIAKRFDSYQWRKLIWFGVGLSAYAVSVGRFRGPSAVLTILCVIGGLLGAWAWARARRQKTVTGSTAQQEG